MVYVRMLMHLRPLYTFFMIIEAGALVTMNVFLKVWWPFSGRISSENVLAKKTGKKDIRENFFSE